MHDISLLRCRSRPDDATETAAAMGAEGLPAVEPASEAADAASAQAEPDGNAVGQTEAAPDVMEEGADADGRPAPPLVQKRPRTRRVAAV